MENLSKEAKELLDKLLYNELLKCQYLVKVGKLKEIPKELDELYDLFKETQEETNEEDIKSGTEQAE